MAAHSELTALAVVVLAALVCGMIMTRLRQPAIVGYILAGIILGPSVFSLVENRDQINFLAELGVLMLLFLIAMELSVRDLRAVWKVALATTGLQVAGSVLVALALAGLFGWTTEVAVLFGFVIALSSTAVVVKMLEGMKIVRSPVGRLTLGVLIAQDLAVVPMILTVRAMGEASFGTGAALKIVLSVALLAWLVSYLSRREKITLPFSQVVAGHVDLTPLAGLVYCFGAAALSGLLGLSPAFGAFLAGLVIGNSTARPAMIRGTRPIQSVLLMLFFLSIGLLFDLGFIWRNLGTVLVLLLIVTVFKTALNVTVLHLLREPWPHAFIVGVMLAQIGEFSFVLGSAGMASGLISEAENKLVIAVAAFSLLFSPMWQATVQRLQRIARRSITSLRETLRLLGGRSGVRALALLFKAAKFAGRGAAATARASRGLVRRATRTRGARTESATVEIVDPPQNPGEQAKGGGDA